MLTYYPALQPYATHQLAVDDEHTLYIEECGNPEGMPVVVIHGGPGAGCDANMRRFFDPQLYRIILFDQRGCGRSTPHVCLNNNTTQDLIDDLEKIRKQLKIKRWVLFGGSWGSTLALLYAQQFPDVIEAMILRGIFLVRQQDYDWLYKQGASEIFPDHWQDFLQLIPDEQQQDLMTAYHQRLTGEDELARMAAAKAWATWEAKCATLHPNPQLVEYLSDPKLALSLSCIECHYFVNHCFVEDNAIIKNMHRIQNIPGVIVHGRYDMVCPVENAWTLHQHWPQSQLCIVRDAGHAAGEAGITDALIHATQKLVNGGPKLG